jgi:DNA ligase-1
MGDIRKILCDSNNIGFDNHDHFTTLYKRSGNHILYWSICIDTDYSLSIRSGVVGGKEKVYKRTIQTNQSGRSLLEQAILESNHRYLEKIHEGYVPYDQLDVGGRILPMLACKYNGYNINEFPIGVQAKLDGIRALSKDGEFWSRTGHNLIISPDHLKHIRQDLTSLNQVLPPGTILDGELYSPDLKFEDLVSTIRSSTIIDVNKHQKIRYYIFDIVDMNTSFDKRYQRLLDAYSMLGYTSTYYHILSTWLAYSHDEIMDYYHQLTNMGYEGLILRKLDKEYKPRRCNNLLKVKGFIDEEGIIVGVVEASGNESGLADLVIQDRYGNIFNVRPSGSFEQRRMWLSHPEMIVGKIYTFRYFQRTSSGAPRFPVGVAVRDIY